MNMSEYKNVEEDYFFKFRDEKMEKLQKRRELNMEYQKFKAIDEERFRNRFAEKKGIKVNQTTLMPCKQIEDLSASVIMNNNLEILLRRLGVLQQNVEDLKKAKLNLDCVQDAKLPLPITSYQCNVIDDALNKLNELETVIKTTNFSENGKMTKETFGSLKMKTISMVNPESFLKENEEPKSIERSKQIEKQRYANELKQQIEEKQRQKELQKQRERDEDLIKIAETLEYDTLGHRIRDKPNEGSIINFSLIAERKPENFARGGNGIFGAPLTESQKIANENYRTELLHQIEEKRLREEKRKQELKEIELKELQNELNEAKSLSCPNPSESFQNKESPESEQLSSLPKSDIKKQSACVQVELEHQASRPKAAKVLRKSPLKEKPQKNLKTDQLLAQITQLKIELAAEKLRMERDRAEIFETIHVYDPRSFPRRSIPSESFKRPIKVHRLILTSNKLRTKERRDRKFVLSSCSEFLPQSPQSIIPQSPSLGSLNLDEINKRMNRRFKRLIINDSYDDLYRNEPPVIRDFMAEEEAKLIANSFYFLEHS